MSNWLENVFGSTDWDTDTDWFSSEDLSTAFSNEDLASDWLGTTLPDINAIEWPKGYGITEGIAALGPSLPSGSQDYLTKALEAAKKLGTKALDFATSPAGLAAILGGYLGNRYAKSAEGQPRGGGYGYAVSAPKQYTKEVVQGKYGPLVQYSANGGLAQAYATGGVVTGTPQRPLQMKDGAFVMTKRAVDGAGGPMGLAQLVPGAKLIAGEGDGSGVDDRVHARIGDTTPARVSAGEMYVPKESVDEMGGARTLYALMNDLQRRAR
jgi:hypothetical protein